MRTAFVYRLSNSLTDHFYKRFNLYKTYLDSVREDFFLENFNRERFKNFCPEKVIFFHPFSLDAINILEMMVNDAQIMLDITFETSFQINLNIPSLTKLEQILTKAKVNFVCQGKNQKEFLSTWIQEGLISIIETPLSQKFVYRPSLRKQGRKKWGIPENAVVFCYSGILSQQKNTLMLLNFFQTFRQIKKESFLFISGSFEDTDNVLLGHSALLGQYYNTYYYFIKERKIDNIILLEKLADHHLNKLYNICDYYISCSCDPYGEEGIDIKQALCAGVPSRITYWSGHKDLIGLPGVWYFSVMFKKNQIVPQTQQLLKHIFIDQIRNKKNNNIRSKISNTARKTFTVKKSSIVSLIKKTGQNFSRFKKNFYDYHRLYQQNPSSPFLKKNTTDKYTKNYEKIYKNFF